MIATGAIVLAVVLLLAVLTSAVGHLERMATALEALAVLEKRRDERLGEAFPLDGEPS